MALAMSHIDFLPAIHLHQGMESKGFNSLIYVMSLAMITDFTSRPVKFLLKRLEGRHRKAPLLAITAFPDE